MTRPIQASLDLQALKQNLSIVRQAAPYARVWSVVKANAYGHGIERIWSALGATDGFALLNLEEAITLRERGWKGPILMLEGFFHAQDLEIYDQHRLTTCVHSNWQLKALQIFRKALTRIGYHDCFSNLRIGHRKTDVGCQCLKARK